jgi:SSS family solute:Na+ symporter
LHFAIFLFVICAAVLIVVSLATPAPDAAQVDSLTVGGGKSEPVPVIDARWRRTDVLASIGLVALVGAIWLIFS